MAHGLCGETITVQVSERIPCDNKEKNCECCKIMTVKLNEVQSELSSCREIIRILQEEIREISSSYQPTGSKENGDSQDKESFNPAINEDWTTHPSNRSRYPRYTRGYQQQLPLETSNRFSPLATHNEDSKHPRYVPHVKRYQSSQDRLLIQ